MGVGPPGRRISILIAARDTRADTRECLAALAPQVDSQTEVLVVCGSEDGTAEMVNRDFGWARSLQYPVGTGFGELRAHGLASATGDPIVFLDVYCRVRPGWLARWREEPWERYAAVGGLVEPAPRPSLADWAAFLSEYGPYLPPLPAGETDHLLGNNVGFRRAALERAGLIGAAEFWKTFALWALSAQGEHCWTDPRQLVSHVRSIQPGEFSIHRYWHGRCFGATRTLRSRWRVRLARAASCPAVPLLLTARLVRDVHPNRAYRRVLWRSLPFALLYHAAWALGELDGYLRGAGGACARLA
ncbi:MAG: glycosyltransferase family 2 protein [Chloroflexota bacterium]